MIWSIIVGGLIGLVAGSLTKKRGSMGIVANVLAGLVGSSVGQHFLGSWGPSLAGMRCRSSSSSRICITWQKGLSNREETQAVTQTLNRV